MAEAPERLFVQLTPTGGTISYLSIPPDNRKPVYEYTRADLPRATGETEALVDEVQRRMDAVVDAAVEWHQSDGQQDWIGKADVLAQAIDSLLELRTRTEGEGT